MSSSRRDSKETRVTSNSCIVLTDDLEADFQWMFRRGSCARIVEWTLFQLGDARNVGGAVYDTRTCWVVGEVMGVVAWESVRKFS